MGAILYFGFGSSAVLGAVYMFRGSYRKLHTWKTTTGTVIGFDVFKSNGDYRAEVRFLTGEGKTVTFLDCNGSKRMMPIGTEVNVMYPLFDPAHAEIKTFKVWIFPLFLSVFGLIFLIFGFLAACHKLSAAN